MKLRRSQSGNERGQVVVIFALLIPVFLALGGFVIGIGNWYTHAKHLQTKADAGAFAGGGSWEFPCGPQIDARIEAQARLYAGSNNPQVGGVPDANIHTVLNGSAWYDDDSNPAPSEFNSPPAFNSPPVVPICDAKILDVKVTEDNSFPLFSLIPLFPDIKRKARVEIQEAHGVTGLLPIAVRAPEPVSAAAVFYDETSPQKTILAVKYFVKNTGLSGLPGGLQAWSTSNSEDTDTFARLTPTAATGVAIAISSRGACDTFLPGPPQTKITVQATGPCFEDEVTPNTVDELCNQAPATQIVNCYYATGNWPSESVQAGLHFIRGYQDLDPGTGPPSLESAYLQNASCSTNGYFNAHPNNTCHAQLHVEVDVGALNGQYPNLPNSPVIEPLRAGDIQVRYRLVRADGTSSCNYGVNCGLNSGGSGPTRTYSTEDIGGLYPHLPLTANSRGNAVAIEIRLQNAVNHANAACQDSGFDANCRWFYTGTGVPSPSVAPTDAEILATPVQRAFRGNSLTSGPVQWLRLTADGNPCGAVPIPEFQDIEAASQPTGGNSCFVMDMGLKGGIATLADGDSVLFNDGVGSSQMGAVDCDPNINQGQVLIDGVIQGCGPWYARHPFDWTPVCPGANSVFSTPNPGPPWDDGRWPALRCIKTRPTGQMTQLERGLDGRLFGNQNQNSCPNDAAGYVMGRNYWDQDTNPMNLKEFGYKDDSPARDTHFAPNDKRIVTIFVGPTQAFASTGQNTYPITGFISMYITGYGRIAGSNNLSIDDPCPGSQPPSDLDLSGGSAGGYTIWGHIINYALRNPSATPSGVICNPGASAQPCVAVLVE